MFKTVWTFVRMNQELHLLNWCKSMQVCAICGKPVEEHPGAEVTHIECAVESMEEIRAKVKHLVDYDNAHVQDRIH